MGFAIDFNDLSIGVNGIQGERADALRNSINAVFEDTLEDYDIWDALRELEEAE